MSVKAIRSVLAANLRAERARSGLGQDAVAAGMRALGYESWVRQTVSSSEHQTRRILAEEIPGLAQVLGTTADVLMRMEPSS